MLLKKKHGKKRPTGVGFHHKKKQKKKQKKNRKKTKKKQNQLSKTY